MRPEYEVIIRPQHEKILCDVTEMVKTLERELKLAKNNSEYLLDVNHRLRTENRELKEENDKLKSSNNKYWWDCRKCNAIPCACSDCRLPHGSRFLRHETGITSDQIDKNASIQSDKFYRNH